jgi:hypothetical protein
MVYILLIGQRSDWFYCAPYCLVRGVIGWSTHSTV